LDADTDEGVEDAWRVEIERRVVEYPGRSFRVRNRFSGPRSAMVSIRATGRPRSVTTIDPRSAARFTNRDGLHVTHRDTYRPPGATASSIFP
jgi:hypothetical protein